MKTIHKYRLPALDCCHVPMPRGATILFAGQQLDDLYVWAEVDTSQPVEGRYFVVYGTGHARRADRQERYVGSVQCKSGLVWHVYESLNESREGDAP